jgi:hypothetical protein
MFNAQFPIPIGLRIGNWELVSSSSNYGFGFDQNRSD